MNHARFGPCLIAALAVLAAAATAACSPRSDPAAGAGSSAVAGLAGDKFKAAGKSASLSVLPARVAGRTLPPVGEAVAMMLERAGMTDLHLPETEFLPPDGADMNGEALALAEFVRANPPVTDYVLFTDILGAPATGITEVRGAVVSKSGEIVWQDRQARGDAGFDIVKPREPLDACLLVALRLRPVLGLSDPARGSAAEGPIAKQWKMRTGMPDKAESKAIESRGKVFRNAAAGSTLLVYAPHAGDAYSGESARNLAEKISAAGLSRASAAEADPHLQITRSMNQQRMLWSMARSGAEFVRRAKPDADYVLFADYIMGDGGVGGVNLAICDRQGNIVAVDVQNSHWPDFKAVAPRMREDCDRLVLKRVEAAARR